MTAFKYFQPTEIIHGPGCLKEIVDLTRRYGKRCLLVTTSSSRGLQPRYARVKNLLTDAGIKVAHFDQIQPNPTTDNITAGAAMARKHDAEVVIGMGGGSSMDSAKAIAVEATHEGTSWDYLYYKDTQPTEKTLPVIAISTTSGTASQVTQVAVVTNTKDRNKSAIYHPMIFPKACLVDPELMLTVPAHITASTGFDAFCHSFESTLHPNASRYTDMLAFRAIELIVETLPNLLDDLSNLNYRAKMAFADTLAGLCIANAGVTLPHGAGMAISGMYPKVAHGEALAIMYPACSRFTYESAVPQFSTLGRILRPELEKASDDEAAHRSCEAIDTFIYRVGMKMTLKDANMPAEQIPALAQQSLVLPDYKGNPRVANEEEMLGLIKQAYYGI